MKTGNKEIADITQTSAVKQHQRGRDESRNPKLLFVNAINILQAEEEEEEEYAAPLNFHEFERENTEARGTASIGQTSARFRETSHEVKAFVQPYIKCLGEHRFPHSHKKTGANTKTHTNTGRKQSKRPLKTVSTSLMI